MPALRAGSGMSSLFTEKAVVLRDEAMKAVKRYQFTERAGIWPESGPRRECLINILVVLVVVLGLGERAASEIEKLVQLRAFSKTDGVGAGLKNMPRKTERMRRRTEENSIVVLGRDDTITPSRLLKLTYNLQVHAVAVHILRPEVRRKTARRLIRRKANKKYRHLVFIRRMKAFDTFLVKALEVLRLVTLEFSKKSVPTISKVLPLTTRTTSRFLSAALLAGAAVATTYINKALVGDYILLGAGER
ncbi:hypothetical protein B0H14DRAFT_2584568 [Mycena olivaceomarginata]|nr:hypothetical protein B0H14DRAFT_2584568 [Mycena olivaceomarginata]